MQALYCSAHAAGVLRYIWEKHAPQLSARVLFSIGRDCHSLAFMELAAQQAALHSHIVLSPEDALVAIPCWRRLSGAFLQLLAQHNNQPEHLRQLSAVNTLRAMSGFSISAVCDMVLPPLPQPLPPPTYDESLNESAPDEPATRPT